MLFGSFKNSLKLTLLIRTSNIKIQNGFDRASSSLPSASAVEKSRPKQTFGEMMRSRKEEATKSIVVQVNSEHSYPELFSYCSRFGVVKNAFHYKIPDAQSHFILVEFQQISECEETLSSCDFHDENPGVPTASRFLWFKTSNSKKTNEKINHQPPVLFSDATRLIKDENLNELLQAAASVDDQIMILYRATHLTDMGTRLRFLAAKQLETALAGMFPKVQAHLFGSSVNGFGKMGCDLDMILQFQPDMRTPSNSRLVFHTRAHMSNARSQMQRQMETLGDMMHLLLPGITHVRKILQARVPIIKFNHECLDLEVDLSMNNLSGVYMSELLYIFGEIDERVRPLIFCVRKWASASGLTNNSPGNWITNFSLTLLVIFFLQRQKNPILPTLNFLIKSATPNDIRITDDHINCTFLRDINNMKFHKQNEDSLSYLLINFFEFYSQFDFKQSAVSLNEGTPVSKLDHSAMWIVNPFESSLNVSKNVSFEELERFKFHVKNAAWILESSFESSNEADEKSADYFWGLLNLFKVNKQAVVKPQMFYKSRLVEVSELFKNTEPKIEYLNNTVENEVKTIRKATKKKIYNLVLNQQTKSKRR